MKLKDSTINFLFLAHLIIHPASRLLLILPAGPFVIFNVQLHITSIIWRSKMGGQWITLSFPIRVQWSECKRRKIIHVVVLMSVVPQEEFRLQSFRHIVFHIDQTNCRPNTACWTAVHTLFPPAFIGVQISTIYSSSIRFRVTLFITVPSLVAISLIPPII